MRFSALVLSGFVVVLIGVLLLIFRTCPDGNEPTKCPRDNV